MSADEALERETKAIHYELKIIETNRKEETGSIYKMKRACILVFRQLENHGFRQTKQKCRDTKGRIARRQTGRAKLAPFFLVDESIVFDN